MFIQIFLFELKYRLKKPGVYLYFLICFAFAFMAFGMGALPLGDKENINSPTMIADYMSMISMVLMLASSAVMGVPLYRDIEYNTREYYLSYPITKAGYFWGRYFGSFVFVFLFGIAIMLGIYCGTKAGPILGWQAASHYGPNKFIFYLQPFLTIALPNILFTSSLFFGLVAIFRNVKVIYSSGILVFMGYVLSHFFTRHIQNPWVIHLSDPFAINSIESIRDSLRIHDRNTQLIKPEGYYLYNRLLWTGIGFIIILYTWFRFSFERFFGPAKQKKTLPVEIKQMPAPNAFTVSYKKRYNKPVLFTLTKIEILNIIRDNYFWIIIVAGSIFLGFIFSHGFMINGVRNVPRTGSIILLFNETFMIFLFCVIIFYTGETIHRERATRFAFINDALPPADWVFNLAKIGSIFCLCVFLTILPMFIGIAAQVSRGFFMFNLSTYLKVLLVCTFPKMLEWAMLSFLLHIIIRNKFAAIGVGITYIVLCTLAIQSGYFNYNLLLYSFEPAYAVSDFDVVGHMIKPLTWFNVYWVLCGMLLLITGYLFYVRGTINSAKERFQLAKKRFHGNTVLFTVMLFIAFASTAAFNYYNVSYLNHYYTEKEGEQRQALHEKTLKRYENMPLPKMIDLKVTADLFPEKQTAYFNSVVTLVNKTMVPIPAFLLDGDNLSDFTISYNGKILSYTAPLLFPKSKFSLFGPAYDSSGYRLYTLDKPMKPGDTMVVVVNALRKAEGFSNGFYSGDFLYNGTGMGLGIPGLGYDDDEELRNEDDRKKYGLAKRREDFPPEEEASGINRLYETPTHDLFRMELTVSTSGDQVAIGPGKLEKQWKENGRAYFKYVCDNPGIYTSPGIFSATYAEAHDSIHVAPGHDIGLMVYYHPQHGTNVQRFIAAYKMALPYYSKVFGPYNFPEVRVIESSIYTPWTSSMTATGIFGERYGWSADFDNPDQLDYCFYAGVRQLARQWWGEQLSPNHTKGSKVISDGISRYCSYLLCEKKLGKFNMNGVVREDLSHYLWYLRWNKNNQRSLLHAVSWEDQDIKAGHVLFGLKDLIGEDSINSALREFHDLYVFKKEPPFAGAKELYQCLQHHVPDSLQYYLAETWDSVTVYDNRMTDVKAQRLDNNQYKVTFSFSVAKTYFDGQGNEKPANDMNDYIDVVVFGESGRDKDGRLVANPLYEKKLKLNAGMHTMSVTVKGKPVSVGIDPTLKLIDSPWDNIKTCEVQQ